MAFWPGINDCETSFAEYGFEVHSMVQEERAGGDDADESEVTMHELCQLCLPYCHCNRLNHKATRIMDLGGGAQHMLARAAEENGQSR